VDNAENIVSAEVINSISITTPFKHNVPEKYIGASLIGEELVYLIKRQRRMLFLISKL